MKKHILKENYDRLFGKREFGDPLHTFEDVMKKHQVNKLKEDWWDDMDSASQAQYIKDHPGSKQAQQADDDPEGGEEKGKKSPEKRMAQIDNERESLNRQWNRLDQPGMDKSGEGKAEVMKKWDALDAEYDELEDGEEPSVEKSRFDGAHMDDVDDSLRSLKQQAKELSAADKQAGKGDIKPPPELERGVAKVIEKIESGTMTDEDLEWAKESFKELRGQAGGNQYLEDMEWDLRAALKKHDSEWKSYARTGNELNQETLTIDGKQFRRISEGGEKQPKPKYEFSEFYQRFKRQE